MKPNREMIKNKYGGRCAYCGVVLGERWCVDHITPKHRGGTDDAENLNPSCARCNIWKSVYTLDEFRAEIAAQPKRLARNANWRLACDFGLVRETGNRVLFYFEERPQD